MLRGVFNSKSKINPVKDDDESSDSEGEVKSTEVKVPTNFRCIEKKTTLGDGRLFMIDRGEEPVEEASEESEDDEPKPTNSADDSVDKVLAKATVKPGFEQKFAQNTEPVGKYAKKRLRQKENAKTTGPNWFNMPATELTEERKRDLEVLMMRGVLDAKSFYRKNDRQVFPKYFQVGTVVDAHEDWYSSRLTRKERKKNLVDELLGNEQLVERSKRKYDEIKKKEKDERKAYFRKSGRGPTKKKKQ